MTTLPSPLASSSGEGVDQNLCVALLIGKRRLSAWLRVFAAALFVCASLLPRRAGAQAEPALSTTLAQQVFETTWQLVADHYVDAAFNGVDWQGVRAEFEPRVRAARSWVEFYALMRAMIARLGDGHSVFLPPRAAQIAHAQRRGAPGAHAFGLAANLRAMPDASLLVLQVPAHAEAARWLKPGDRIIAVEGLSLTAAGAASPLFDTRARVRLTVTDAYGHNREAVVPKELFGSTHFPPPVAARRLEGGVGYLALFDFSTFGSSAYARDALMQLTRRDKLTGLVIDLRANEGGVMGQMLDVLGMFLEGVDAGAHVDRVGNLTSYTVPAGRLLPALHAVPIVLLVGETTHSAAEIFAAVMQVHGRARVVGSTTSGNTELVRHFRLPDGSSLWLAVASYRAPNGAMLEGIGVVPDLTVDVPWWRFVQDQDPQLVAAVRMLRATMASP